MTVSVATTIENGVILQLDLPPNLYATPPAYQTVKLLPVQTGGVNEIDATFWAIWQTENSESPLLTNGLIFET